MTIKFQRVKRSAPRAADRASTQSSLSHSIEEGLATYVASQPQTETHVESLQIGNQQIELLGDLHEALAHYPDRRLQQFFDYWLALASERGALPSRQAIDPLQMPRRLIGNLFITEVVYETGNQPRFRFRLLGQEITEREFTRPGQYVHELGSSPDNPSLEPHYLDCLNKRIWLRHTSLEWAGPQKSFILYDVLLLPLARDGRDVDATIGLVIYNR